MRKYVSINIACAYKNLQDQRVTSASNRVLKGTERGGESLFDGTLAAV